MPRVWKAALLAGALSVVGCKSGDKRGEPVNSKPNIPEGSTSRDPLTGSGHWLDGTHANTRTQTPPAGTWINPNDPAYDYASESRGQLAGFVEDADGRKIANAYVRIEPSTGSKGEPYGVLTMPDGSFLLSGLKPGQSYTITVEAKDQDRTLVGRSYAKAPNVKLRIPVVEGEIPKSKDTPKTGSPKVEPSASHQPRGSQGWDDLPAPIPLPRDHSLAPVRGDLPDGGFTPVEPRPVLPAEEPVPPSRPDLMTGDRGPDWRSPAASIPKSSDLPRVEPRPPVHPNQFQLVDLQNRTRNVPSGRPGELVLLDFMTTTCLPCQKMIPTLMALQEKYAARGLEVMAVTCDDENLKTRIAFAERYRKKHDLNYQIYAEPGEQAGAIRKRFGVNRYPTCVLLNSRGDLLWQGHPSQTQELVDIIERSLR